MCDGPAVLYKWAIQTTILEIISIGRMSMGHGIRSQRQSIITVRFGIIPPILIQSNYSLVGLVLIEI